MMEKLLQNLLTADLHGSIVILAVLLLRAVLRKTPKKYICFLWMLAGLRLLLPVPLVSSLSLQPLSLNMPSFGRFLPVVGLAYGLLAHDCSSALESVGLDAYVGYLHRDRAGRESLALDLMEELRPCFADRFVLTLVNNRVLKPSDFDFRESGAVLLTDTGRRTFLQKWQERKKETITHPFLDEKMPWGLVPYVQSLLLARYLRGDLEDYPPFLWK